MNQEDIKLDDIIKNFPLKGQYIFRFKYKFQTNTVWLDIAENAN